MRPQKDALSESILDVLNKAGEPLETVEIVRGIKGATRITILYRLYKLMGEGLVRGKQVGSGKGTWIWWKA